MLASQDGIAAVTAEDGVEVLAAIEVAVADVDDTVIGKNGAADTRSPGCTVADDDAAAAATGGTEAGAGEGSAAIASLTSTAAAVLTDETTDVVMAPAADTAEATGTAAARGGRGRP
jgi:hypothetical protein